jgi:hypothetical protein
MKVLPQALTQLSGNVAGVALTLTGTDNDDNGGDASKVAASYAMDNGLTLKASVEDESLAQWRRRVNK